MTTELETRRLSELEDKIERGLQTFVEVGDALSEIRDDRLYRESHSTFEDYCRERWGFNRQRASQLIQNSTVSKILDSPPATESHVTELAALKDEPEQMAEAWQEAQVLATTQARPVTAADVREAVQTVQDVPVGVRKQAKQQQLIQSIVSRMEGVELTLGEVDLDTANECKPSEEKGQEWIQQLTTARTGLTRLIRALEG